ncbi:MAG: hypothetical protein NBV67_02595 [Tagaea sp.]|nr:hypothetical protein [Tagaea sp.]
MRFFAVFVLVLSFATAAQAADDPRPNTGAPKLSPEAEKLNQRNPHVFHAGPGRPLEGSVYIAPSRIPKPETKK